MNHDKYHGRQINVNNKLTNSADTIDFVLYLKPRGFSDLKMTINDDHLNTFLKPGLNVFISWSPYSTRIYLGGVYVSPFVSVC